MHRACWHAVVLAVVLAACPTSAQLLQSLLTTRQSRSDASSSSSFFPWGGTTSVAAPAGHYCRMEKGSEHSFCGLPYELSNFQGHFKCEKSVLVGRPADQNQLSNLVKFYPKVKAVGVGHSWWREQFCSGTNSSAINIVTTEFTSTLPAGQGHPESAITIDESAMTATVAAGVTQRTLLKYLDNYRPAASPDGYTLPAFSWFIDQTMGGAVATATHGSSFLYGSLSSQLRGLTIMDAHGNIRKITQSSDPHLWKAATVSVGRLGIILDLTIAIVKNQPVRRDKTDIGVQQFVESVSELQQAFKAEAAAGNSVFSMAVWQAVKPWNEMQLFWFIPNQMLWKVSYTRINPIEDPAAVQVIATDGPGQLPEGAHTQMSVASVGTGLGIETGAQGWSDLFKTFLSFHVTPKTSPARESYVSISELENKVYASFNSYDQYEVAIPLSKAGDCLLAVQQELYGPSQRWRGFRSPALVRFIRAEQSYLSPANGEPVMFINIEDHVSYATKQPNADFQAIMDMFRSPVCGPARLHWGKAGWPQHAKCFDGAKEYPNTWCDFGCAVQQMDPYGKFAGEAGANIWQWNAVDSRTGTSVNSFNSCCSSSGFDHNKCKCALRTDCSA